MGATDAYVLISLVQTACLTCGYKGLRDHLQQLHLNSWSGTEIDTPLCVDSVAGCIAALGLEKEAVLVHSSDCAAPPQSTEIIAKTLAWIADPGSVAVTTILHT